MELEQIIACKIKEEIEKDPMGVGYSGKSDEEVTVLLNSPVRKQRIVEDASPSPMNRILSGIALAPNMAKVKNVLDSKIMKAEDVLIADSETKGII